MPEIISCYILECMSTSASERERAEPVCLPGNIIWIKPIDKYYYTTQVVLVVIFIIWPNSPAEKSLFLIILVRYEVDSE